MKYDFDHEEALLRGPGKLSTHPHIFCVKCQGKTTAFGSNLKNKISKAGGLKELLTSFECRACRSHGKTPRLPKAPRKNKGLAKSSKAAELIRNMPKMVFQERRPLSLLDNPDLCAQVTSVACQRPDLFLNAGRTCQDCNLYSICSAPCRTLGKKRLAA